MGAKLQNWVNKNIWDFSSKSALPYNPIGGAQAYSQIIGFEDNFSNEVVTERRALGIATVYTCMQVRSQTIGALPGNVIQDQPDGNKESLTDHPAYYLLAHQPNNYMSSANMFMTAMLHTDGWGNGYIGIDRNGRGAPTSLELLCPWDVDDIQKEGGSAWYKVRGDMVNGRDIIHFRLFSLDGLCGLSPIRQNQMLMGKALKSERFSAYALGKKPPGILGYEGNLSPESKAENSKTWEQDINAGRTPVLSGRWKFEPVMLSPADAQYIETEGLTDQKIYGIFRIPPVFAQDFKRATFTNAEQSDLLLAKHTITPIIRMMEQEINMKMFTEREKKTTSYKFNMNGLLRGDLAARSGFYNTMRNIGAMNANEIRSLEDQNSYKGGEDYLAQGALVPVDMLREIYSSKVVPQEGGQSQTDKSKLNGHNKHVYN